MPFDKNHILPVDFMGKYLHLRTHDNFRGFRSPFKPKAYELFDWVIGRNGVMSMRGAPGSEICHPKNIFCFPNTSNFKILTQNADSLNDVVLVVAGGDHNLSLFLEEIEVLTPHCKKIYYEGKNVEHPFAESFSMGFIDYYLTRFTNIQLEKSIENSITHFSKKRGILASWGGLFRGLDNRVSDRINLINWLPTQTEIVRENLTPDSYLKRMSESKYFICPRGSGVQSPKLAEAWLLRTVPIAINNPCFYDLKLAGYPLILLESWDQISGGVLESYESWYSNIDWDRVDYMLTVEFFEKSILNNE